MLKSHEITSVQDTISSHTKYRISAYFERALKRVGALNRENTVLKTLAVSILSFTHSLRTREVKDAGCIV